MLKQHHKKKMKKKVKDAEREKIYKSLRFVSTLEDYNFSQNIIIELMSQSMFIIDESTKDLEIILKPFSGFINIEFDKFH